MANINYPGNYDYLKGEKVVILILGLFDWIENVMSNAGSGFNTMASNVFQCFNEGPRLVYEPLHYDYSTTTTTTEAAVVRTYGKRYNVRMANIYINKTESLEFQNMKSNFNEINRFIDQGPVSLLIQN